MTLRTAEWFVISVLCLFLSHVLRAARQGTLFPKKYAVRRFDLLLGLAIGYALNAIVPLRLGEAIRVFYVGRRCRIRYSFVAATVLAERLSDLVIVGLLYAGFAAAEGSWRSGFALSTAVLLAGALVVILFAVATNRYARFRRAIWIVASIFNQQIRSSLLDACWSFSELVTSGTIFKGRFLFISPVMWALYLLSYWSFAKVIGAETKNMVSAMLGSPLHSTAESIGKLHLQQFGRNTLPFVLVPVFLIIIYGLLREYTSIFRVFNSLLTGRYLATLAYSAPISDRFHKAAEYEAFLVSMFSNEDSILTDFSMAALADGAVQRLFPGGSDAVTALVEVDDTLLIRKFAVGKAAAKLRVQAEWLRAHKEELPVVEIIGSKDVRASFAYDMPYIPEAVDFYDTIHTSPFERSKEILTDVIDRMLCFHARGKKADASEWTVEKYIDQKVVANAVQALNAFSEYATEDGGRYMLNGREYSLDDWNVLRDAKWLRKQITDLRCSTVHGDLTVENIIVSKDHTSGFYIIDPNPENIFDTPLIDWAKLMQSLHLGYESLNRMPECKWRNGELSLLLPRSHAYTLLHQFTLERLNGALGQASEREIMFHEIVNYLRLTPYKLRHSPTKGLAFFGCTSILLRDYLEAYGGPQ